MAYKPFLHKVQSREGAYKGWIITFG